jgi:uncharacterized protein GlcG (DUF336 family)
MATTVINKQSAPSATTATTLYTCPSATTAVISSIVACNRSATATTIRIAIRALGAALATSHYLYYDLPLDGNDTFVFTGGATMIATDLLIVYTNDATVTFTAFIQENT